MKTNRRSPDRRQGPPAALMRCFEVAYLSIGGNFFYFDHAHHWALAGELGIAYTGEPDVSLTRTGPPSALLDRALRYEEGQVKEYAEKFMWWPMAKLMVTYSF